MSGGRPVDLIQIQELLGEGDADTGTEVYHPTVRSAAKQSR